MPPRVHTVGGGNPTQSWWESIPPITKWLALAFVFTTTTMHFGLLNPYWIFYDWPRVFKKGQIWRLLTSSLFVAPFDKSMTFIIYMLYLLQYGSQLESQTFQFNKADMIYMLLFGITSLLSMTTLAPAFMKLRYPFFGKSIVFMIMYVWSKNFPETTLNIMGLVPVKGFYLPFAFMALTLLMDKDWRPDAMGIAAGHLYYFLHDLYPAAGGPDILRTPRWLNRLAYRIGLTAPVTRDEQRQVDTGFRAFAGRGRRLHDD